jgi:hypothetical protein
MKWERFKDPSDFYTTIMRCAVQGGWLVRVLSSSQESMAFLPDPEHTWDPNEDFDSASVLAPQAVTQEADPPEAEPEGAPVLPEADPLPVEMAPAPRAALHVPTLTNEAPVETSAEVLPLNESPEERQARRLQNHA